MKKARVLITYDAPNWAYHKNAKILQKYLSDEFDISTIYDQDKIHLMKSIYEGEYDLVFHQWYRDIDSLLSTGVFRKTLCITQIATTSIFEESIKKEGWQNHKYWPLIVAKNKELYERLSLLRDGSGVALAYHVNDTSLFFRDESERKTDSKNFRVGFVGHINNPRKGYDIVKTACDDLGVELKTIGFNDRFAYEDMPAFYRGVDCTVCASNMEGAPNPMLESGLVGTPIITTCVGQIQEMISNHKNALIIDRNVDSLKSAITALRDDVELRNRLSVEISKTCQQWNELAIQQWRNIFSFCVKNGKN